MLRKKSLAIVALCGAAYGADTKELNKTFALNPTGSIALETWKGSIHVTTWDRPEVAIQARIEAASSSTLDHQRFDKTEVAIDSASDSLQVRTMYPPGSCCSWNTGQNPEVHYTIQMPRTARVKIHDHRSEIEIRDLEGGLDLETHRGTVRVQDFRGPLELSMHRGDARVDFAAFTGNSRVETHRGSVELLLPKDSRFNLDMALNRKASLQSDFVVLAHLSNGHGRGQNLAGPVNGGGPSLRLDTDHGQIHLRAK